MTTRDLELVMPPPPVPPDPVEQARSEVEKLFAMEAAHADRGAQARKDEQDLSTSAGVLDLASFESASTVDLARRLSEIHAIAILADRAVELCRQKRREAIQALYLAEAAALREQASAARSEAAQHQGRVDALLTQLEQLDGVRYVPQEPPSGGPGVWSDTRLVVRSLPIGQSLQLRAEGLDQQALAKERRPVQDQGAIGASSQEDALSQLAALGPLVIGPPLVTVQDWLAGALAAAEQKRVHGAAWLGAAPVAISLRWSGGELDRVQSRVVLVAQDV